MARNQTTHTASWISLRSSYGRVVLAGLFAVVASTSILLTATGAGTFSSGQAKALDLTPTSSGADRAARNFRWNSSYKKFGDSAESISIGKQISSENNVDARLIGVNAISAGTEINEPMPGYVQSANERFVSLTFDDLQL